jgi:hypothetical protein
MSVHRIVSGYRWLVVLGLLAPSEPAAAQRSSGPASVMLVSATVVTDRLSVAALRPIAFAAHRHAVSTTVQPTDAAAGEWRLIGTPNAMIQMKVGTSPDLVNSRDSTAARLAIGFSPTAARWRRDVDDPAGATTFDPRQGVSGQFGPGSDPALYVWLGGSIQPSADTAAGDYRGTITLTVFYY